MKSDKNSSYTIEDINNLFFFNKTQIDEKLNYKANWTDVYTHNQINTLMQLKSDKNNSYTITEVDERLILKSNISDVYNKVETTIF